MEEMNTPPRAPADVFSEGTLPNPRAEVGWDGPQLPLEGLGSPGTDLGNAGMLVRHVQGKFNTVQSMQLRTNGALYELLGLIYQAQCNIGSDAQQVAAVAFHARERIGDRETLKRWKVREKTLAELLIAMLLTLAPERKVTRHQWNGAIRAAKKAKVEPTEQAFVAWIEATGGIVAANKLLSAATNGDEVDGEENRQDDTDADERDNHPPPDVLQALFEKVDPEAAEQIEVALDPEQDLAAGFCLLLTHSQNSPASPGKVALKVLGSIHTPSLLEAAATELLKADTADAARISVSRGGSHA